MKHLFLVIIYPKFERYIQELLITELDVPKDKKKKKKAKQFISFDDEDSSILSSSLPSSSSSILSETNSTQDSVFSKAIVEAVEPEEIKLPEDAKTKLTRGQDKFSSLDGPLTPVSSTSIGKLTPISFESQKTSEIGDNISDDTVEVPTDISAVLTVVENMNKEEIRRLREKVNSLLKENDSLKEQLKNYVSAIQMLDQKGEDGENTIEHGDRDYQHEAKVFEKKLIQVISICC